MTTEVMLQGKVVKSKQELMLASVLTEEELPFRYQVAIDGGTFRRGGYLLDFEVYTPMTYAVPVQGNYWHKNEIDSDERLMLTRLEQIYGLSYVKPIWESEMQDIDAIRSWVRSNLK